MEEVVFLSKLKKNILDYEFVLSLNNLNTIYIFLVYLQQLHELEVPANTSRKKKCVLSST